MAIRSALSQTQDEIADKPNGVRAIDFGRINRTFDAGAEEVAGNEQARASAASMAEPKSKAPPATAKVWFNPRDKSYFVGGHSVPARYDTLKYLSEAEDLPSSTDAPPGYVPLSQGTLKTYVQQIHSEMEGTPLTQLWDSFKSATGAAVAGIPRLLGYDIRNNLADSADESYKSMSLREQAGADEGAFDSFTGFTNSMASGVGSAVPAIGAGIATTALTANPAVGLATAGAVGFSSAGGDDSEQVAQAIAQNFVALPEDARREASTAYATLRDHGVPEELAIDQVAMEASRVAGLVGGLTTIPETLIGGKLVGNFLRKIPGLSKLMGTAKEKAVGGVLGQLAERTAKIPAPLRFLARTTAVGGAEGVQEVTENVASNVAGNLAAGVGSTNPTDFMRKEDFEGGFTAGIVFGAVGGNSRAKGSDLGMAMGHIEAADVPTPQTPPTMDGMGAPPLPDMPLERQLELVHNVLAERFGDNWMDHIDFLAQDPGARQLLGQYSGIQQEIQRAAQVDPGAPVDPYTGAQGDALPFRPQNDGAPAPGAQPDMFGGRSLRGPEAGAPSAEPLLPVDPNQPQLPLQDTQPDPRVAGVPSQPQVDPRAQAGEQAMAALIEITGAQSFEELQALLPELQALAQEQPELGQALIDSGLVPIPLPGPVAYPPADAAEVVPPGAAAARGPAGPMAPGLRAVMERVRAPEPIGAPSEAAPGGDRPLGVAPAPLVNPEPMSPEEAASRQQTQIERGETPTVDDELGAQPETLPALATTPEPVDDVAAQIDALVSPDSQRRAVFVAEGNEDVLPDLLPPKVKAYSRPGVGTLLTSKPAIGKLFMTKPEVTDADIASLLGLAADKATVMANAAAENAEPIAVQAVTPEGNVAAEALTTPGQKVHAAIAVKKQARSSARVVEKRPQQVQTERTVKLGPKGMAVREAAKKREAARSTKVEQVKKKSPEAPAESAPVNRVETIARAAKKAREHIDGSKTVPAVETPDLGNEDGRSIPLPKTVFVESGSREGPVDLRVQLIDETKRAQLRGWLQKAGPTYKKSIESVLAAFDRAEAALLADVKVAEDRLIASYMKDPHAKDQYKVELAKLQLAPEEEGRPRQSVLYALPLLDHEMVDYVEQMVEQAKHELSRKLHDRSLSLRMLNVIIPQAAKMESFSHAEDIIRSIANLDKASQQALIAAGAPGLRKSTLAKQVTRGATEVSFVATRGEEVEELNKRSKAALARIRALQTEEPAKAMDSLSKRNYAYVTGYGEIPQQAAKLVSDWARLFESIASIKAAADLRVMTVADAVALLPNRPDIRRGVSGFYVRETIDGKPVHIFAVDWAGLPEPVAIEALAHEFGHFVAKHAYDRADTRTRAAVQLAFKKWKQANVGKSTADVLRSRLPPAAGAYLDDAMAKDMNYANDFDEWSADNVARWLMTQREPKSLVDKYFATIAKVLRAIYESVVGKGAPDSVWQSLLDAYTASARAKNAVSEQISDSRWDEIFAADTELPVSPRERLQERQQHAEAAKHMQTLRPLADLYTAVLTQGGVHPVKEAVKTSGVWDTIRKYGLQLVTTHQMVDLYKDIPAIHVPLKALVTIRDRIDARARKLQTKGADALARAQNLSPAVQNMLQRVMKDATYFNLNPEVPLQHPTNEHVLRGLKGEALTEQGRRFQTTQALYDEMTRVDPRTADIYADLRQSFEDIRAATIKTRIENLRKGDMTEEVTKQLQDKLQALLAAKREGPYFPLMRNGEWIVTATMPAELYGEGGLINDGAKEFTSKTAANKEARDLKVLYPGSKVSVESEDGHYTVRVYRRGVYFFDTEAQAVAAGADIEKEVRGEYAVRGGDFDATAEALQGLNDEEGEGGKTIVSKPFKKLSSYEADQRAPSDDFMVELRQLLRNEDVSPQVRKAVEEMYLEAMPEFSFRKSQLRRDNVLGASDKMLYSFAHRYAGAAHNLATIEDSDVLNNAWKDLKASRSVASSGADVANTIALNDKLVADRTSGTPGNRALNLISDLNSFYSLALSPSYVMMNAAQPAMITVPYLSGITKPNGESVGIVTAAKYVKEAYAAAGSYFSKRGMQDFVSEAKRLFGQESTDEGTRKHADDILDKFAKTPHERQMLTEMMDRGLLDFSFLNSLQDAMRSGKIAQKLGVLTRLGMAIPQQVEAMNRVVTALAAYRLATRELGMEAGSGDPIEFVASAVRKTQLDYSRKNRPVLFNKPLAGMVLQFRLYTQGMYMLFVENAIKALRGATMAERKQGAKTIAYLLGTHAAIGGVAGIAPIVTIAKLAAWALLKATQDDDDKDQWKSVDDMMRDFAEDMFGKKGGRAVMNGLPTLINVDLSAKLGLPSIYDGKYTGTNENTKSADAFDNTFLYMLGSPYANARRLYAGMGELAKGNFTEASKALPAGMRAAARATVFADKGILDKDGDVFVPRDALGWSDLAVQGLGFQTADVSEAYRERSQKFDTKARVGNRRLELMQAYRTAEDSAGRKAVREQVREYNKSVPPAFRISYEQLQKSVEAKRARESGKQNRQDEAIDEIVD
jgi:hypothetical protein